MTIAIIKTCPFLSGITCLHKISVYKIKTWLCKARLCWQVNDSCIYITEHTQGFGDQINSLATSWRFSHGPRGILRHNWITILCLGYSRGVTSPMDATSVSSYWPIGTGDMQRYAKVLFLNPPLPWASVHWLVQCTLECHWNATGVPSVHWDTTGPPSEYFHGALEHHWKNLVETTPHWNATGGTVTFAAYTGTPLEGLWQPTHVPTHIVKHAK